MKTTAIVLTAAMLAAFGLTEARADNRPPVTVAATDGGVQVGVDVLQTGRGWGQRTKDHLKRTWPRYLAGAVITGTTVAVGEHNDWFRGSDRDRVSIPESTTKAEGSHPRAASITVVVAGSPGATVTVNNSQSQTEAAP